MGKLSILIFLIFLAILGLFAVENKDIVTVKIPFSNIYEVPKIALILIASTFGALSVLVIFFIRDTKRFIDNIQQQKRQKKEAKIQELYSKSLNLLLSHKEEEAKEFLIEIIKEEPEYVDAYLRLGDIATINEDFSKAYEYYKQARDINPSNLQVLISLVIVLEKLKRYDEALRYIDEMLDIDSENLTALYKKRSILEKKERWDELLSLQKTIFKLQHNEKEKQREADRISGYRYEYARFSLENGEIEKAEKSFRTILKMDSKFIPAYLGLTEIMISKGETEEAINFLEKSYEQLQSLILLARLEDLLISVGEPGRLIRYYKNAITKSPQDNVLKFLLGKLYFRLEMVDDAIETLNSIDTNVFSIVEIFGLKGELYMKRNQISKAIEEFKKACGIRLPFKFQYYCSNCEYLSEEWSGRCPNCFEWNTYVLNLYGTGKK
jgi:lipopolysaccharide biosynthesis regulator YciM